MMNPKAARAVADGKDPLDYLEPLVNAQVSRAMKHGADKYGYRNYTVTPCKVRTYIGAARRHLDALARGEDIDPDSGLSHWAHVIAGSACYFACELTGIAVDDRAAVSTPLSDRVHIDGDLDAKGEKAPNWDGCADCGRTNDGGCTCEGHALPSPLVEIAVAPANVCLRGGGHIGDCTNALRCAHCDGSRPC